VCEAGLAAQLNQENCVELLSLAHTHQGGAHLKRVTLAFIKEQSHEIFWGGFFAHTHQGGAHLKGVTLSFIKGQSHEIFFGDFLLSVSVWRKLTRIRTAQDIVEQIFQLFPLFKPNISGKAKLIH
jgi:hypothetical protein